MKEINYIGETLWIGKLGYAMIIFAFVSALFSVISYAFAIYQKDTNERYIWKKMGKIGFLAHGISIFTIIGLIFYAMISYKYEYNYVFNHVSDELDMKYVLSAMWEGQEGSFLLWMFWHVILGYILIYKSDKYESPVLATIAAVQLVLVSMIMGIYIGIGEHVYKFGSNPLVLIRDVMDAPIFSNAQYLSLIKGRGLNPLLQNYWMTIHPPTLFLGFASTVVPFAYAIGGLILKEDKEWIRPVMKWALFSGGILGTGILMGSLWAFEALSFGGYWAWDPVENTSLVPWIVLVAGIHTNLIAINTGRSIKTTYLFYILSFIFVLYSTLLTRSGILGDTSAHAFTEMGLEWQLSFFILIFLLSSGALFFYRYKTIPSVKIEESIYSREFWMVTGSLVLFFSAILITTSSSLPVLNAIIRYFNPSYAGNVIKDPIAHYNKYQLWIAVIVSALSAKVVWMRYKDVNNNFSSHKKFLVRNVIHALIAGLLTFAITKWIALVSWQYVLLTFTALFSIVANADYFMNAFKKDIKMASAAISHLGFGMMLLGIVATGLNQYHLNNPFVFKGLWDDGSEEKYVQLIKNSPLLVRGHIVNYESDTLIGRTRYYDLSFKRINDKMNVIDSFRTRPNAVYANDFSKIAAFNPDTKHYFGSDIFTCVMSVPPSVSDAAAAKEMEDTLKYENYTVKIGDSLKLGDLYFLPTYIDFAPKHPEYDTSKADAGFEVEFELHDEKGNSVYEGQTAISINGSLLYKYPEKIEKFGLRIRPQEEFMDNLLSSEETLEYKEYTVKKDESIAIGDGITVTLQGFEKDIFSKNYEKEDGDIAIAGVLQINDHGHLYTAKPIFIIRGNAPMSIKDYTPSIGLHSRLSSIDPVKEKFVLKLALDKRKMDVVPVEIAQNVPRADYIILEAKVFPGINLYWLGSILMMLGLFLAWIFKKNKTFV